MYNYGDTERPRFYSRILNPKKKLKEDLVPGISCKGEVLEIGFWK